MMSIPPGYFWCTTCASSFPEVIQQAHLERHAQGLVRDPVDVGSVVIFWLYCAFIGAILGGIVDAAAKLSRAM